MIFLKQFALLMAIVFLGILPTHTQAEETEFQEIKVHMKVQEYNKNAFVEIPHMQHAGESTSAIEKEITTTFFDAYEKAWNKDGANSDIYIATYPFDGGEIIQYIITSYINSAQDGLQNKIASFAFRKKDNTYLDINYILKKNKTTTKNVINIAKKLLTEKNFTVKSVALHGAVLGENVTTVVYYLLSAEIDKQQGEGLREYIFWVNSEPEEEFLHFINPFNEQTFTVGNPLLLSATASGKALHFNRSPFHHHSIKSYGLVNTNTTQASISLPKEHPTYLEENAEYSDAYMLMDLALMNAHNSLSKEEYNHLEKVVSIGVKNDLNSEHSHAKAYKNASQYIEYMLAKNSDATEFYYAQGYETSLGYASVHTDEKGIKTYYLTSLVNGITRAIVKELQDKTLQLYNWSTNTFDTSKDTTLTFNENEDGFTIHIAWDEELHAPHYVKAGFGEDFEDGYGFSNQFFME